MILPSKALEPKVPKLSVWCRGRGLAAGWRLVSVAGGQLLVVGSG